MNTKAMVQATSIIFLVVGILVGMYVLEATFVPLQSASTVLSTQLGGNVVNESLGTADVAGNGNFNTVNFPVVASTWSVYANGTDSGSWLRSTVAVTLATGAVAVLGNQNITNETLGTAATDGNGSFATIYSPILTGWTVYANGISSANWVNATATVTLATGAVVVNETGTNPTTASAVINMTYSVIPTTSGAVITMSYSRDSGIPGLSSLSGLPGVAVLLFMLLVIISFIMMAIKAMD